MLKKTAIIIGAGPAGLTAAYELLETTDIQPIVFEMTGDIGGISKTVEYQGNRIDIGGHRFFSKSDWVMDWWQKIMPLQGAPSSDDRLLGRDLPLSQAPNAPDPEKSDLALLIRQRLSRIFFLKKFFDYPINLNFNTLANLGLWRLVKIGLSYLKIRLFPIAHEKSLEDFFINRFGRELYRTFFRDYTQKVWGVPCNQIPPEWGAQRVKGLSITKAVCHAFKTWLHPDRSVGQKSTETTLISQFLYPKLGPGQLWEEVARLIEAKGGQINLHQKVVGLVSNGQTITAARVQNMCTEEIQEIFGDYFFSTMPIPELIAGLNTPVPENVKTVANGLMFRDFITVGLLLKKLKITNQTKFKTINCLVPDNWIYIQERQVRLGRLQIFNNWSPYLIKDRNNVWIGLEYFCNDSDDLWNMSDSEFTQFAIEELDRIRVIDKADVLDSTVIHMPKTYPGYFGTYNRINEVREFTDQFKNLFLIGRNGMHRYNNAAHSMLTAKAAVENITRGVETKENIWAINIEEDAFEKKLTAVENLTDGFLKDQKQIFDYHPDQYWREANASYATFPSVRHRLRFILNFLKNYPLTPDTFVFDYGCGIGHVLQAIKTKLNLRDDQLGGCDVSREALDLTRQKIKSPFLYNNFFPSLGKPCQIILCSEVIEHTTEYAKIINWIKANLAPGGWLILTTQAGKIHASDLYTGHTQHFKLAELKALFQKNGWTVLQARQWGFPWFTLQKYLTDINFGKIKKNYIEGELTVWRRLVFDAAYLVFCLQDWIPLGPQIYLRAVNFSEKQGIETRLAPQSFKSK